MEDTYGWVLFSLLPCSKFSLFLEGHPPSADLVDKYGYDELKKTLEFEFKTVELIKEFIKEHGVKDLELIFTGSISMFGTVDEIHAGGVLLARDKEELQELEETR